jgi:hypothetical protein
MSLLFHDGQPLDERCLARSGSRQNQNATTRPFGKANANCAEQLQNILRLFAATIIFLPRGVAMSNNRGKPDRW